MEHLPSSYLYAVQEIPGETREEKFKAIGKIVTQIVFVMKNEANFEEIAREKNVPNTLVPLVKVLVGLKTMSNAFIIEALKSDDIYLIFEALKARWFFDGTDDTITNYNFFSTKVLPFVSMSTRRKIVKKLAQCLGNGQTALSEDFFNGFLTDYGVSEASIFLPGCRSEFIYDSIVKYKIVLSCKLLKTLYRKYPDLILLYLNFVNPYERRDEISRTMFRLIDINEYESFMPLLITKHPEVFISMQEICHTSESLGTRRTRMFLKNAKELLIQKPRDIIELMPIKLVYDSLKQEEFEVMFGNTLEDRWDMFNIDNVMNYLEYYPKEKRAALLKDKVKERYGHDLYDKLEKITPKYLLLLPQEERYNLARRIIEVQYKMEATDPETSWWCFLPPQEAIPALKKQIVKNWRSNKRQNFFSQLIYVCKLNKSKEALLEVLKFVDEHYQTERSDVICGMLDRVSQEFDIDSFDQNYWVYLFNIIKRIKLKKENARDYWVLIKIMKKNVHYHIKHNLPVDEIIDLMIRLFVEGRVGVSWKLLEDEPEYERRYLHVCFNHSYWLTMDYKKNVVEGIYNFNERHVTADNSVPRLSIKDYPHLMKIVEETLKNKENAQYSWILYTKEKLKTHEPELYADWFPEDEERAQSLESSDEEMQVEEEKPAEVVKEKVIYITEAIIALKRNFSEIKEDWERYYECCREQELVVKKRHRVKQFLKSLLWYHEVPVKFVERAIKDKNYSMIGYLLNGATFSKVAQDLLPSETEASHYSSYLGACHISTAMKNASTPISTSLVEHYLSAYYMYSYKNYINDGLKMWTYVAYRTGADRMIALARSLSRERLFLKRHAIRLMDMMASRRELVEFLGEMWRREQHRMIRDQLAEKIGRLFSKRPSEDSWQLISACIADLGPNEDDDLETLIGYKPVPVHFASGYISQVLGKLRSFVQQGVSRQHAAKNLDQLLDNLRPECWDYLSEDVCREILQYYLENVDVEFNNIDRFIVKIYLNPTGGSFDARLNHLMVLLKAESNRWYGLSADKRKLVPNLVDNFVHTVVYQVQKFKGSFRLVDSLSTTFAVIFPAHEHAWSHVMLFLCTEYMRTRPSFKQFGLEVSNKVPALLERYTPEFFMQIVELVREFICNFSFYEYAATIKNRLDFLEGLIDPDNTHGCIIAAKLLNQKIVSDYNSQHCLILNRLAEVQHPIVQALL